MNNLTLEILLTAVSALAVLISALAYKEVGRVSEIAQRALNKARKAEEELRNVRNMIPDDLKEQHKRHDALMSELNDELEKRIESERVWNETVNSILNYSGPDAGGVNGNGR
jgi:hypothetical protein